MKISVTLTDSEAEALLELLSIAQNVVEDWITHDDVYGGMPWATRRQYEVMLKSGGMAGRAVQRERYIAELDQLGDPPEMTTHTWKRRKLKAGSYEVLVDGTVVGDVHYNGSHLDDYPWDWSIAEEVTVADPRTRKLGSTGTLGEAVDAVVVRHLGNDAYWSSIRAQNAS